MSKRTTFLALLLFLLPIFSLVAQPATAELDQRIEQARLDWDIPGLAVGIVYNGEVVLSKGYGTLEAGAKEPVDGETVFAIASNTKAFISAAIGMLVEEGKLSWDDPVRKHLPYFALYDPYVSENTTVRDLLCHRVGLGTFSGDVIWYKSRYTAEETVRHARYVPQAYGFRAGYGYTNLMFIAAGEVIRAVSGQTWAEFVRARIFTPLEMDRTRTSVEELKTMKNVATPHKSMEGENQPIAYANWDNMGAAGGILSGTDDMLKWIQLQIDQGTFKDRQLFSRNTQLEWWTLHNNFKVSDGARELYRDRHFSGYGLGWNLADYAGRLVASHGGGYDGMYSRVAIVPEARLGIVVLTNSMKGISTPLTYQIIDHFLGLSPTDWLEDGLRRQQLSERNRKEDIDKRRQARIAGTRPSFSPQQYAGIYYDPMFGEVHIEATGDQLRLKFPSAPDLNAVLRHWHYETFEIEWEQTHAWFDFGTLQFLLDNDREEVLELQFDVPNGDIFFHEIHAKRRE